VQTLARGATTGTFDLLGTGTPISSGWISRGDGFLAVDRNGNGSIDSIDELFGGLAKGSGFAQLAAYDSNGDGVVDAKDANFADLRIWQDANSNHQTDAGELMTLAQAGIASLKVGYTELPFLDKQGNLHLERSSATLADGRTADMTDVYFSVSAADAAKAGVQLPNIADLLGGDTLDGALGADPGGMASDMSLRDHGHSPAAEMSELLRRLTEAHRDNHMMATS